MTRSLMPRGTTASREAGDDPRPVSGDALEDKRPTDFLHSLLHEPEAESPPGWLTVFLATDPCPVVRDDELDAPGAPHDHDLGLLGAGVTLHVEQRFACHLVDAVAG